ncbi:hypothetical protein K469DRAFT_722389 [Zopfia rhizophila CBS 207.26]|uniref:Mediator of RNA polymerase II transcription subunit 4 n=1 Tax=Zopfia rhizophila CBS 207.26 TaxID=1314779 RepID=A0A6A6EUU4_9PEZI|nr:hypothetical protein K469DRAFT_722389 [Zopfia rhizophila CBS 207.26]
MDIELQAQFHRVETALGTLVDSIASYNPSPQAAVDLVAADDELGKGLDQLAVHQANHARILSLRHEAEQLESQLKGSLTALSSLRHELLSTPVTSFPETSYPVPYDELLRYARNISKYTVPPTYREPKYVSEPEEEKGKEDPCSGGVPSNGVDIPAAADALVAGDETAKDQENAEGEEKKEITPEQEEWLRKLFEEGHQWAPWPSHEKIRRGNLMQIQHFLDRGDDPSQVLPPAQQEEEDRRRAEEEERDKKEREEREEEMERLRRGSLYPGGPRPSVSQEQQPATFGGLDMYDPDDDDL